MSAERRKFTSSDLSGGSDGVGEILAEPANYARRCEGQLADRTLALACLISFYPPPPSASLFPQGKFSDFKRFREAARSSCGNSLPLITSLSARKPKSNVVSQIKFSHAAKCKILNLSRRLQSPPCRGFRGLRISIVAGAMTAAMDAVKHKTVKV